MTLTEQGLNGMLETQELLLTLSISFFVVIFMFWVIIRSVFPVQSVKEVDLK